MSLKDYISSLVHKRVTVVGAGVSNRPLIGLLADGGVAVTVCDRAGSAALGDFYSEYKARGVRFCLGESYLDGLSGDVIFRTPGMHPAHPALRQAVAQGALLTSEMEVFCSLCPCRVFAVTGSDGKTSTTSMLAQLLRDGGYKVWLGGNIGRPLLAEVDSMQPEDVVVLELSSFQLHSMLCSPDVAVITNLSPNHLDVHPDYADYVDAKKQIYKNQKPGARLVLNLDNGDTAACAGEARGAVFGFSRRGTVENGVFLRSDGMICLAAGGQVQPILNASELIVPGAHNVENMMAAFAAAAGYVSPDTMADSARRFPGVAHRMEIVRRHRGVTYINDSIASSPNRTVAGLSCFDRKIILLAGGKDKGLSFEELGPVVCKHVKELFLTGMTAEAIRRAVTASPGYDPSVLPIHIVENFEDAVKAAAAAAVEGDVVMLSPASTSFDRFKNFEERGNLFRHIIETLE